MQGLATSQLGKNFPVQSLIDWFNREKRDLPWRKAPSFYEVLISEIMLQQTQVQTVIPYFKAWMKKFPSIAHLAEAPLEEVIKAWEGLGYYSRARNLHKAAQALIHQKGDWPRTYEALRKYPGIGDYTASAILAFAYNLPYVAIDGNVLRVGARFFGLELDIKTPQAKKRIKEQFEAASIHNGQFAESLIELGATVCKKKPDCPICPLQKDCQAYRCDKTQLLPIKAPGKKTVKITRSIALVICQDRVLICKKLEGIMQDLYEFPDLNESFLETKYQISKDPILMVQRSFTHFHETLKVFYYRLDSNIEMPGYEWVDYKKLQILPLSGGHRKIRDYILQKVS